MNTIENITLPQLPDLQVEDDNVQRTMDGLRFYFEQLHEILIRNHDDIYHDLQKGKSRHQIFSSAPTTADLDKGEIAILDAATDKIYTRVGDTMRSVDLA